MFGPQLQWCRIRLGAVNCSCHNGGGGRRRTASRKEAENIATSQLSRQAKSIQESKCKLGPFHDLKCGSSAGKFGSLVCRVRLR